ncbi:NAD-glutamate dehydrogenase [Gilvimarinus sp. SDUM040013]|uniref:NAD-glutamate dehydrogenase n=1 Tax=Gilvimarinus gilvus TaxID=3058038 RepID=A0ABU4RX14_9GAMM|nr:NAD-glutamate dehydrogenase [Gilvimarinus sp. SDUM040013]MDO3385763.1 NAD-glutamate dehydrogenase [Gilvimarinus sp. SDUM040013]MDX6849403.1 NAD-glutamate dehydrogenase [Gilvimarinus sp. SDUM040013]
MEKPVFKLDVDYIAEQVAAAEPSSDAPLSEEFVRLFFHHFPFEDLVDRPLGDIAGCLRWLWGMIKDNTQHLPLVQVVNPGVDSLGWSSPFTVIAVRQADMPFLVDSIRIELANRNIPIYSIKSTPYLPVRKDGDLVSIEGISKRNNHAEALIYMEVGRLGDARKLREISLALTEVLEQIDKVVTGFPALRQAMLDCAQRLGSTKSSVECIDVDEAREFLNWLADDHFTFLGYSEFNLESRQGKEVLVENRDKRLGLFDSGGKIKIKVLDDAHPGVARFYLSPSSVAFSKSPQRSRIHRSAYPDYVVVKRYDDAGKVIGECRFLGLYTSSVYSESPASIPLIREKVAYLYERMGLTPWSHEGKAMEQVVETFPRDELFQSSAAELYDVVRGILEINERYKVRLFLRKDRFGKFVSCLVYVPRELFSTQVRQRMQTYIGKQVGALDEEFNTFFSESLLARVHFVFRVGVNVPSDVEPVFLEREVEAMVRSWQDKLLVELRREYDEEQSRHLVNSYADTFGPAYQESFSEIDACKDIAILEQMSKTPLWMDISVDQTSGRLRLKLYNLAEPLALSDIIPLLENFGLRVLSEYPYKLISKNDEVVWLHDFILQPAMLDDLPNDDVQDALKQAFFAIWEGYSESDIFGRLTLSAGIGWRDVITLRAYANYMQQILFGYSFEYVAEALINQSHLAQKLVELFHLRFSPEKANQVLESQCIKDIEGELESVQSLSEDKIIRQYLNLMKATVRTNYFKADINEYLALKLMPRSLSGIPEPKPMFEMYVYSNRFEGVHLRGGKVARGGLRWSDRPQDYRTEVLGLVKAQQVKNAVIVPNGAKGGFVCKQAANLSREEKFAEGKQCYRLFIDALLSVADNVENDEIVSPVHVLSKDDNDPYLVVAADKGTATFSDIANDVALKAGFWLGDAFASGGSQGYDHKAMGITAKGAWVCVQRHFKEQGIDVQNDPITVVGVGDMAGDVFGNGMLCSESIKLVAAFNHLHIFIDPNPDQAKSFAERKRLFSTPGAQWSDYSAGLISQGGGVYERSAKSITLSSEAKSALGINETKLAPAELIHLLLMAPVDLIWNGGIGTYVKASTENHAQVGDKANDMLRVNGQDLRCKVFGEGGNLGMTQMGRVEFCLNGGACNTDFIDNSAGVDCSDHEVNVKIALSQLVKNEELTADQRNALLVEMTDEVSADVLHNNYRQSQALSLASRDNHLRIAETLRFIHSLESSGRLNRTLEFLPDDEQILERQVQGTGLTRPELSVLLSYAKVGLKEDLAKEEISGDVELSELCLLAFPETMRARYPDVLRKHALRKEIIATQLANDIVNTQGCTFVQRMQDAAGVSVVTVAKAYYLAKRVGNIASLWSAIEALSFSVEEGLQQELMQHLMRRVRRMTRWFLRNRRGELDLSLELNRFCEPLEDIQQVFAENLSGQSVQDWHSHLQVFVEQGVPEQLCQKVVSPGYLYSGLGVVDVSVQTGVSVMTVAKLYAGLVNRLNLSGFAVQLSDARVENYWQAMAREAYMDDLESQVRSITQSLSAGLVSKTIDDTIETWAQEQSLLLNRWLSMVNQAQTTTTTDYAMFSVALRELLDLAQVTRHAQVTS